MENKYMYILDTGEFKKLCYRIGGSFHLLLSDNLFQAMRNEEVMTTIIRSCKKIGEVLSPEEWVSAPLAYAINYYLWCTNSGNTMTVELENGKFYVTTSGGNILSFLQEIKGKEQQEEENEKSTFEQKTICF